MPPTAVTDLAKPSKQIYIIYKATVSPFLALFFLLFFLSVILIKIPHQLSLSLLFRSPTPLCPMGTLAGEHSPTSLSLLVLVFFTYTLSI